ncbi:MAG: DNA polymerase III subunit gamma/tau [Steroidobacteraceae bacterium]|jgi:DNA polymerase-3 subunit gamma/tau|nr:DNA polymerase III subunit gamma/tau [Steroidobacteraceae bacterium]
MSYTALARKWRPRDFGELTGQEHVLRALTNALASGRVHHAFLFTGTRGVGKTTISRILAKCLNCETGPTATPCGECAACREIDEGRFIDLIEVDAASRTKVDDTRELLDNVQYAPTRGRYKVYLIDEVHMLSAHSFNALLKTLEEPPPHVKFLLATTDPQKLPVTVLSRCLQFNLKRLPVALIAERMRHILEAEAIAFEPAAVRLVALAADGSMRDGLSLLDQLIAFGGGKVDEESARAMLGTIDRQQVVRLVELLAGGDPAALLDYAQSLEQWSPDHAQMLDALAALLARIALKQAVPDYEGDELHDAARLSELAGRLAPEDVQLHYQAAIVGRRDLQWAPDPRTGFEMTLLRMMLFRPGSDAAPAGSPGQGPRREAAPGAFAPPGAGAAASLSATGRAATDRAAGGAAAGAGADVRAGTGIAIDAANWSHVLGSLELSGLARQLAAHCAFGGREGALLRLVLDARNQHLRTPAAVERLAQGLGRYLGEAIRIEVEVGDPPGETPARAEERQAREQLDAARASLEADPTVRALKEKFGATLKPDTVRPHR